MAQNRIWLEIVQIVQIALDLLAWMPMLADRQAPSPGAPPHPVV
jgi:hypothetical protein